MPHRKRSHRWWKNPNPHIKGRTGHQRGRPNLKWGRNLPDVGTKGNVAAVPVVPQLTVPEFRSQLHDYRRRLYDLDYSTDPQYQQQHGHQYYGLCNELSVLLERHLTEFSSTDDGRRAVQECQRLIADIVDLMTPDDQLLFKWEQQLVRAQHYQEQAPEAFDDLRAVFRPESIMALTFPNPVFPVRLPGLAGQAGSDPANPHMFPVRIYHRTTISTVNDTDIYWHGYAIFPALPGHPLICPRDHRLHLWFRFNQPLQVGPHNEINYPTQDISVHASRQPYTLQPAGQPPNLETLTPGTDTVPYDNNGRLGGQPVTFLGPIFYVMAESDFQYVYANHQQRVDRVRALANQCDGARLVCMQLWERYERERYNESPETMIDYEDQEPNPLRERYDQICQQIESICNTIRTTLETEYLPPLNTIINRYTQPYHNGIIISDI